MGNQKNILEELDAIKAYVAEDILSEIDKDIVLEKLRSVYEEVKNQEFQEEKIEARAQSLESEQLDNDESESPTANHQPLINEEVVAEQQEFFNETQSLINDIVEEVEENLEPGAQSLESDNKQPITEPEKEVIDEEVISEMDELPNSKLQTPTKDLGQKLGKKPISNIATAIGINERFQFINELFEKNADTYSATIEELNGLQNFAEALDILQTRFNWDYENELVERFVSIVERRYL